ncbi:MAG TPA: Mrp/NBP35 family ATP-binding protein [bacterium]|nr:Mrp/NBP35 family ATP-binding protein [bacterium]
MEESKEKQDSVKERMGRIKHKILVMSGKGGVGKTTVAVNLAYLLAWKGSRVGLLDVDLHGPNVAKMLGIEEKKLTVEDGVVEPFDAGYGLKVISMALILDMPDEPVIWRGPLKMSAIKQFLGDVKWGDLDYLIIDSPPGTGDEPLSVCQLITDIDGIVIVTTPQEVALLDSKRAVKFAQKLDIPVIGIIENMSGFVCPHCKKEIDIFGTGGGEQASHNLKVPFLGRIPLEPDIVKGGDNGQPFIVFNDLSATAGIMDKVASKIIERTKDLNKT